MPSKRTLLGAAAFSLALAGGGVAGAVLGTPSLSGAQDDTTTTAEAPADAARPDRPPKGHGPGLETAAEVLGLSVEDLRAELEAGRSIAQVAEAQGVDVQDVVDALVAKGTERLEQAIAELPERARELVDREGLPERRGPGGPGGFGHGPRDEAPADAPAPADDAASDS